jgi:hypothetical protein
MEYHEKNQFLKTVIPVFKGFLANKVIAHLDVFTKAKEVENELLIYKLN